VMSALYGYLAFAPLFSLRRQRSEAKGGIWGIRRREMERRFVCGRGRTGYVEAEHGAKPEMLSDALMHHVFEQVPAARVGGEGTDAKIGVGGMLQTLRTLVISV